MDRKTPSAIKDPQEHPHGKSAWGRFWRRVERFEEAMETTHDDVQDRRIARLEEDLKGLAKRVDDATPDQKAEAG